MKQRPVGVGESSGPIFDQWLDFEPLTGAPGHRPPGRSSFALAAVAVVLSFTACTTSPGDRPPAFDAPQPPPLSASASVSYLPSGDVHLSTLRSVSIAFSLIGAGSTDLATIEFIAPNGSPYETRPVPLRGTAFEQQQLEFSLPVGGTLVETAQLTGNWKAVLRVNGQVAAAPGFDINP